MLTHRLPVCSGPLISTLEPYEVLLWKLEIVFVIQILVEQTGGLYDVALK